MFVVELYEWWRVRHQKKLAAAYEAERQRKIQDFRSRLDRAFTLNHQTQIDRLRPPASPEVLEAERQDRIRRWTVAPKTTTPVCVVPPNTPAYYRSRTPQETAPDVKQRMQKPYLCTKIHGAREALEKLLEHFTANRESDHVCMTKLWLKQLDEWEKNAPDYAPAVEPPQPTAEEKTVSQLLEEVIGKTVVAPPPASVQPEAGVKVFQTPEGLDVRSVAETSEYGVEMLGEAKTEQAAPLEVKPPDPGDRHKIRPIRKDQ
jgi:hypothetical protein